MLHCKITLINRKFKFPAHKDQIFWEGHIFHLELNATKYEMSNKAFFEYLNFNRKQLIRIFCSEEWFDIYPLTPSIGETQI